MKKFNLLSLLLLITSLVCLSACSDDDEANNLLSPKELTLYAGETAQLNYNGECSWSSDEPLIADVDNNGLVTANLVGVTNIHANDEICKVTVNPRYNTYMEPYTKWGASESEVTEFMSGYSNLGKQNQFLVFSDSDGKILYFYSFTNNLLESSSITADIITMSDEITDFLLERYVVIYVDESTYTILLESVDGTLCVGINFDIDTGLMMVIYMPGEENISSKTIMTNFDESVFRTKGINKSSLIDKQAINELVNKFKAHAIK